MNFYFPNIYIILCRVYFGGSVGGCKRLLTLQKIIRRYKTYYYDKIIHNYISEKARNDDQQLITVFVITRLNVIYIGKKKKDA